MILLWIHMNRYNDSISCIEQEREKIVYEKVHSYESKIGEKIERRMKVHERF